MWPGGWRSGKPGSAPQAAVWPRADCFTTLGFSFVLSKEVDLFNPKAPFQLRNWVGLGDQCPCSGWPLKYTEPPSASASSSMPRIQQLFIKSPLGARHSAGVWKSHSVAILSGQPIGMTFALRVGSLERKRLSFPSLPEIFRNCLSDLPHPLKYVRGVKPRLGVFSAKGPGLGRRRSSRTEEILGFF